MFTGASCRVNHFDGLHFVSSYLLTKLLLYKKKRHAMGKIFLEKKVLLSNIFVSCSLIEWLLTEEATTDWPVNTDLTYLPFLDLKNSQHMICQGLEKETHTPVYTHAWTPIHTHAHIRRPLELYIKVCNRLNRFFKQLKALRKIFRHDCHFQAFLFHTFISQYMLWIKACKRANFPD